MKVKYVMIDGEIVPVADEGESIPLKFEHISTDEDGLTHFHFGTVGFRVTIPRPSPPQELRWQERTEDLNWRGLASWSGQATG